MKKKVSVLIEVDYEIQVPENMSLEEYVKENLTEIYLSVENELYDGITYSPRITDGVAFYGVDTGNGFTDAAGKRLRVVPVF